MSDSFAVSRVTTKPFEGQQTGTSGLRKKVAVVRQPHYIENWLESLFQTVKGDGLAGLARAIVLLRVRVRRKRIYTRSFVFFIFPGATLVVGGDGRYWNRLTSGLVVFLSFFSSLFCVSLASSISQFVFLLVVVLLGHTPVTCCR